MDPDLIQVADALRDLSEAELHALIDATNKVAQISPGLLAWVEHAADWELHRRSGREFSLNGPAAAIPPEEESISIDALTSLKVAFSNAPNPVEALLDAVLTLLARPQRLH